jgi:transcription antitermination factor NusG
MQPEPFLSDLARVFLETNAPLKKPPPIEPTGERSWFVLMTEPSRDKAFRDNATEACPEHEVYYPILREFAYRPKRLSAPREITERPAMAGYVFVNLPAQQTAFQQILAIRGCRGFLGGDSPLTVQSDIIDDIKRRESAGEFDATTKYRSKSYPKWCYLGSPVSIKAGPFSGLGIKDAAIAKIINSTFISVTFTFLRQPREIGMPLAYLEKR